MKKKASEERRDQMKKLVSYKTSHKKRTFLEVKRNPS